MSAPVFHLPPATLSAGGPPVTGGERERNAGPAGKGATDTRTGGDGLAEELEAELDAARRLQKLAGEMILEGDNTALHHSILDAASAIARSDMASIQMMDAGAGGLRLLAWRGFHPDSARGWELVGAATSTSCGKAFSNSQRVIIPDVETCGDMAGTHDLELSRLSGIRSVQSTPLITREGRLIGMVSTHWRSPHVPGERELRWLDLLARQAADALERRQNGERLQASEARQAFLLELGDALRPLADPVKILEVASRMLGERLNANRAGYAEAQPDGETVKVSRHYVHDVPGIEGVYRYVDYGPELLREFNAGCMAVRCDIANDPSLTAAEKAAHEALQIGAMLNKPLMKDDRLLAILFLHFRTARVFSQDEIALLEEVAERTWAAVERSRAEAALRVSEEKYRTLFESIDEGFCIIEMVFDDKDNPVDYRFLEVNPAFEHHTGLNAVAGRTVREMVPEHDAHWYKTYGRIALTGRPERFEHAAEALGRFFDVYAFRVGRPDQRRVAVLFNDISERKRRERNSALLAATQDDLARLTDTEQIMEAVGARLGMFLKVARVYFADVDDAGGEATIHYLWRSDGGSKAPLVVRMGEFANADFLNACRAGETVVVRDTESDPRARVEACRALRLRAAIGVPFSRLGEWKFVFALSDSAPRDWREDEIEVCRELANRLFPRLERSRAEEVLAADLRDTQLLREVGARLVSETEPQALYDEVNAAARLLTSAVAGTVQIYDPATQDLTLISTHGFPPDSTVRFGRVNAGSATSCGAAIANGKRTFVDFDDPCLDDPKGDLKWHVEAGVRSAQSTPLIARSGKTIGMLSTHWAERHRPTERELRFIDLLARQAADLIEQRQAEQKVKESQERMRIALDAAAMAAWDYDVPSQSVIWNNQHYRLLGLEPTGLAMRGADFFRHVHPEDREAVATAFHTAIHETGAYQAEFRIIRVDGETRWMNGFGKVTERDGGRAVRVGGVMFDITERRQTQEALASALHQTEVARAEAEAASRAKDQFLAVLSHELRTPLTPSLMAADMLLEDGDLPPLATESVAMIQRNIRVEARLVDDLLDVTRIARGKLELALAPVDLHAVIRDAMTMCQPELEAGRLEMKASLNASTHGLQGDAARLQQVVWNLLKNACKFSPREGVIQVATSSDGHGITLQVTDMGIGIDPDALQHIFDPFTQANEGITRRFGGLGLGLAISEAIVKAHHGRIWAESEGQGKGATFKVVLPLQ